MTDKYNQFKTWLNKKQRTVGEVHTKLHELYKESDDLSELTESELFVYNH